MTHAEAFVQAMNKAQETGMAYAVVAAYRTLEAIEGECNFRAIPCTPHWRRQVVGHIEGVAYAPGFGVSYNPEPDTAAILRLLWAKRGSWTRLGPCPLHGGANWYEVKTLVFTYWVTSTAPDPENSFQLLGSTDPFYPFIPSFVDRHVSHQPQEVVA